MNSIPSKTIFHTKQEGNKHFQRQVKAEQTTADQQYQ